MPAVEPTSRAPKLATIGLVGGLIAIVAIAVLGISEANDAVSAVQEVERSHRAIESLDEVLAKLGEARFTRRALGITRDARFRTTYINAIAAVHRRLDILGAEIDSDEQRTALADLRPVVDDRIARLEAQRLQAERDGKDTLPDEAQSIENSRLDDRIRQRVDDMINAEHELLEIRERESRGQFSNGKIITAIGAAVAFVLVCAAFGLLAREVRQRRRAEHETAAALADAEAINHELETFSYSVSHDLRAPLRAIDGFSQALLEDNGDRLDEAGKRHLDRVRGASARMTQLIDDLLALSRVSRAPVSEEKIDLASIAKASFDELRAGHSHRKLEVAIADDLDARGDARLLRIVFDNLLGNAVKFTSKQDVAHIDVGATTDNGERCYFVKDDGVGFEPQYAGKLFGPFQRLHDASEFPGTGIGLATVQRIIRRHGGRVWATSEPGHGATFLFTLG